MNCNEYRIPHLGRINHLIGVLKKVHAYLLEYTTLDEIFQVACAVVRISLFTLVRYRFCIFFQNMCSDLPFAAT